MSSMDLYAILLIWLNVKDANKTDRIFFSFHEDSFFLCRSRIAKRSEILYNRVKSFLGDDGYAAK